MDAFDLRCWKGFAQAGGIVQQPAVVDQITIDSRRIDSPHSLFVALNGTKEDGHHYVSHATQIGAKFALVARDYKPSHCHDIQLLRVDNPLKAFQEIACAYRLCRTTKILAITGSFGKTMVKDLLYSLLNRQKAVISSPESFNSQIGVPLSLLTMSNSHHIAIIEAAISKKDEMDVLSEIIRPNYTLLTPVGKKHMATLQDVATLMQEIFKLVQSTLPGGWSLLHDDPQVEPLLSKLTQPWYFWNEFYPELPHASFASCENYSTYNLSFPNRPSFQGHIASGYSYFLNLINMAVKAAWLLGISAAHICEVLQDYQPEPRRTEIWKSANGSLFINDIYSSDPQSIDGALNYFHYAAEFGRKIFVFGGIRSHSLPVESMYRQIGNLIAKKSLHQLLLVGEKPFKPLIQELNRHHPEIEIVLFDTYGEVFSYLKSHLKGGDVVLFKGDRKLSIDLLTETFNDSLTHNQCMINLASIRTNLEIIRNWLPCDTRVMLMVKALAYGTDDVIMAKFLVNCGIDILGVAYVDEGISLKRGGIQQAIFVIHAAIYEVAKVVKWGLEVGVSDAHFIVALGHEAAARSKHIKVHLHIDTGMGRFGCRPEDVLELAHLIRSQPFLELDGVMTHLACADNPDEDQFTYKQIACFDMAIEALRQENIVVKWTHACSSSGALRFCLPQYNMVRLGLACYGLYVSDAVQKTLDLKLAFSLTSRIVGLNICKKGETISYGRSYHISREVQKIAVLPIGYFDGLHRSYSGSSHLLIQGKKAPMVGNICMDYMMVDVTDIPQAVVGEKVLIFGEDEFSAYCSPEEFAKNGNSIVHELITCLGPRIQRLFIYEESKQLR